MKLGSRMRVHDAAKALAFELQYLTDCMEDDAEAESKFRVVSMQALSRVRFFLEVLGEEVEVPNLDRPLYPLAQALLDYEITSSTPEMFISSVSGRRPATVSERNRQHLCAWLQAIYRQNGLSRKKASDRLRRVVLQHIDSERMVAPKTRTLEAWYDNCQQNGPWRESYVKLFDTPQTDPEQMPPWNLKEIDKLAVELINNNLRNF